MKINALGLLIALMLLSCQKDKPNDATLNSTTGQAKSKESMPPALLKPKSKEKEYVILPFSEKPDYILRGSTTAQLSLDEVNEVYRLVQRAVEEYNAKQVLRNNTSLTIDLNRYRLQIIPALNANGEKVVWVNALCSNMPTNWQKYLVDVLDGGKCYFKVNVNLLWQKWSDFYIHGYA